MQKDGHCNNLRFTRFFFIIIEIITIQIKYVGTYIIYKRHQLSPKNHIGLLLNMKIVSYFVIQNMKNSSRYIRIYAMYLIV